MCPPDDPEPPNRDLFYLIVAIMVAVIGGILFALAVLYSNPINPH